MEDSLSIIKAFLNEYNVESGSDYEVTAKKSEGEAENALSSAKETAVDTSSMTPSVEEAKAKKKRPALRVIEGGSKAIEAAKVPSADNLPTPGGIGFLLFTTLFILFALVKVSTGNGSDSDTRLGLIWKALTGSVSLGSGTDASTSDPSVHTGASVGGGGSLSAHVGGAYY